MLALSDDELLDFVASGSLRAFTILSMRKLPWLALCALKGHGDRNRALEGAGRVMLQAWDNAPLWPPRSGRLDGRLLELLDTKPGLLPPDPQDNPQVDDEEIAALLRQVVAQCTGRPQRRASLFDRLWGN